jgi:sulfatase maturation enzyme AslB (radical SAM superfamily)
MLRFQITSFPIAERIQMKLRKEKSGLHLFDRVSGVHILFDEIACVEEELDLAPRTVSVALTNKCNCSCDFCYANKNDNTLTKEFVMNLAKEIDQLGALELTFGGGEPLVHPDLAQICEWIWKNTSLGISITTNGHFLTQSKVDEIKNHVSSIRVSIDSLEPEYSMHRNKALSEVLDSISYLKGNIPFGLNVICRPGKTELLKNIIELAIDVGAMNVLIIPEHVKGRFILTEEDWNLLENIISIYDKRIQLYVTYDAATQLNISCLDTEVENEFLFIHISADRQLKRNSYDNVGKYIDSLEELKHLFYNIKIKREVVS